MNAFAKVAAAAISISSLSDSGIKLPATTIESPLKATSITTQVEKPTVEINQWERTSSDPFADRINRGRLFVALGKAYGECVDGKMFQLDQGRSLMKVDTVGTNDGVPSEQAGFRVYIYKKAGLLEAQDWSKPSHVFAYDIDCNPIKIGQETSGQQSSHITRKDVELAIGARQNYLLTDVEKRLDNFPEKLGKLITSDDGKHLIKFSDILSTGENKAGYFSFAAGYSDQKPFYSVCVYEKAGALSKQSWEPTQVFHFNTKGQQLPSGKENGYFDINNINDYINRQ